MKILVVVDMQEEFLEGKSMANAITRDIIAIADSYDKVIGLEYHSAGESDPELAAIFDEVETKYENDGSHAVHDTIVNLFKKKKKKRNLDSIEIDVVGIYFEFCVQATALGLQAKGYNVRVLGELCIPDTFPHNYANPDRLIDGFDGLNIHGWPDGWEFFTSEAVANHERDE